MKVKFCYLDNAATSFPKPPSVAREVTKCLSSYCGNAGRGAHRLSLLAANKIYECREELQALINAPQPENIVFVPSCTYGLNLILKGILKRGDHVILSDMEHNAVYRPLSKLQDEGIITFDTFSALSNANNGSKSGDNFAKSDGDGELISSIRSKLRKNTKLLVCNHQSNVCSYSLPLEKIGTLCKENHILFAVDCAQSMGHLPIDMQKMNIDFLASPGHKGLYGLQGSAFVAINSEMPLQTLVEGGNGINSIDALMGDAIPERHEAGTLPLPSIVGLLEGVRFIKAQSVDGILEHERELFRHAREGLLNVSGVKIYAPDFKGSTMLFNVDRLSPQRVSAFLDENGICVRSGLHCAPLAHKALGTLQTGGIRLSFGYFNTKHDIDKLLATLNKL